MPNFLGTRPLHETFVFKVSEQVSERVMTDGSMLKWLTAIKDFPLWVLAGAVTLCTLLLWAPNLRTILPKGIGPALIIADVAFFVFFIFRAINDVWIYLNARYKDKKQRDLIRFERLYVPLYALFSMQRPLETYTADAPNLHERTRDAIKIFSRSRNWWRGTKTALRKLFDTKKRISAEVISGTFPLNRIIAIVRDNERHADNKLLELVGGSLRSRYDEGGRTSELSAEDLALLDYIERQRKKLAKYHS